MAADILDMEPVHLMGHIASFWLWALDNVPDGELDAISPRMIARAAQWRGDPEGFLNALIEAEFIDKLDKGLVIHDWFDYAGKLVERRIAERERSRQRRASQRKKKSNDQQTTNKRPVVDQQTTVGTVPYSTVPNNSSSSSTARARTEIMSVFEKEFGRLLSPMEIEQITQWEKEHSQDIILEALKRAALGGNHTFKYINGILLQWKKNNIRTIQEVERLEADFKARKADRPRARGAPVRQSQLDKLDEWAKGAG